MNGIVWWFIVTNLIGFLILKSWRRAGIYPGRNWAYPMTRINSIWIGHRLENVFCLVFCCLFWYILLEAALDSALIVDLRFIFPFASDLTPYRWLMFLLYFPFLLVGFTCMGTFLNGQIRRAVNSGFGKHSSNVRFLAYWPWLLHSL